MQAFQVPDQFLESEVFFKNLDPGVDRKQETSHNSASSLPTNFFDQRHANEHAGAGRKKKKNSTAL